MVLHMVPHMVLERADFDAKAQEPQVRAAEMAESEHPMPSNARIWHAKPVRLTATREAYSTERSFPHVTHISMAKTWC